MRLLRALYFASEREHGQGARDKMAHALGNLASLAPGSSVRSLSLRACERYSGATGNNEDPAIRRAAASALRSVAVRASNQLVDGGPNDIWCRRVLPMAFLGQRDEDSKIASLWKEVWDEGGSASAYKNSDDSTGVTLEEKLLPYITRVCISAMEEVSWAPRVAACSALLSLCAIGVLAPPSRNLQSQQSFGPSDMKKARRRAFASRNALRSCVELIVKPRVWTGKTTVVKAAVKIAAGWVWACQSEDTIAYGWEGSGRCPWAPLYLSRDSLEDLFREDNWFATAHSQENGKEPEFLDVVAADNPESENGDTEAEEKIDFEEGDKVLGTVDDSDKGAQDMDVADDETSSSGSLSLLGLCRALLAQGLMTDVNATSSSDEVLPYRAAALEGLADLLKSLRGGSESSPSLKMMYDFMAPALVGVIDTEGELGMNNETATQPPLIVARSIDCIAAALWNGIGDDGANAAPIGSVLKLSGMLQTAAGPKQAAWTVRESAVKCTANLASSCHFSALRKHALPATLIETATHALKDRKFWRVRLAGLEVLYSLVSRVERVTGSSTAFPPTGSSLESKTGTDKRRLILEALLPHKESILLLARSSLTDSEAKVTSKATDVCNLMAWWP